MKRLQTKLASILLILSLMISLMPAMTASAASTLVIKNLYTETDNAGTSTARPTDNNLVTRITQLPFVLNVETTNLTDSQIPSIYFEITNINSGAVVTEKNNKAQIAGSNLVKFDNIQLSEGLNKVVVYLGESSAIASAPGWLYYAPTTNLSNITVNNEQLDDGKIYPVDRGPLKAGTTGIQIKTKASNASAVQATLSGDSLPKLGFKSNDGYFYFTGDDKNKSSSTCSSVTSFCLTAGDNIINFTASNDTNKYQVVKKLWYDNGQPFAFNGKVLATGHPETSKDLINIPTFQTSALTFTANVKSDFDATGTSLKYRYVDVAINDASVGIIDLGAVGDVLAAPGSVTGSTYSSVSSSLTRSQEYAVKSVSVEIPTLTGYALNEQRLTFTFRDISNSLIPVTTEYKFKYVDPAKPYIDKTTLTNGTIENELSLTDDNLVNELPGLIHIYTNTITDHIRVKLDGFDYPDSNDVQGTVYGTTGLKKFDITLQGISDGNKKLSIELYDVNDVKYSTTDYKLTISNAPYVIINNISNSMSIRNIKNLTCGTTEACISGRLVNFYQDPVVAPAVPGNKVEVFMNESLYTLDSQTIDTIFAPGTNAFTLPLNLFNPTNPTDISKVLIEGKNTLKFKIYVNNVFITEQSYDIYLFSTDAPQFTLIKPVENGAIGAGTQYVAGKDADTYTTTQRTVSFSGIFTSLDANGAASPIKALTLVVHTKDAKGDALVYQQTIKDTITVIDQTPNSRIVTSLGTDFFSGVSNTLPVQTFTTNAFKLLDDSDVVFEFRITNNSNITSTRSITITRQNVPYTVVQPLLIKNPKGELQSNINSDFYNIILEAENADSVVFGKDEATKRTVNSVDQYLYQVRGLKPGANAIKFTITRKGAKVNGSFVLFNTNTNVQGMQTLQLMNTKFKIFNGGVQLSFPKDTKLMRNVPDSNNNQYISTNRKILFGIADTDDGRMDKTLYPVANGYFKSKISVKVPEDTFHAASNLYYMDAGYIPAPSTTTTTADDLSKGLNGTGLDPYDATTLGRPYFNRLNDELVVPSQEGSLLLQFDPAIRQDAGKYITVFFYDIYANYANTTDYGWKNLGGVVDNKNNTITVPFRKFGYYQVMYMDRSFDDMTGHSFARTELETLYSKGVMRAKTTFSFGPNDYITRGEFAQILVKVFKLPMNYSGSSTFSDVLKIDNAIGMLYDYKYIETAARAGIIRGQASNRFNPSGSITRQDAAVMIARAAEMKMNTDLAKSLTTLQKTFTDADNIESYSRPAVEAVSKAGLIEGIENTLLVGQTKSTVRFDPTELLTRAQASIISYRVMKQQKMVP